MRAEAQVFADSRLNGRPLPAERGEGACPASEHCDEQARCGLLQPLDVAHNLVDPNGDLVAEGRRHRVLAMRAARQRHLGAALGQLRHGAKDAAELSEEDAVRLAQHQEIAGLGDVLCGGPPVHPATVRLPGDPRQLPDEWHKGVARARKALVDAIAVELLESCSRADAGRSTLRE